MRMRDEEHRREGLSTGHRKKRGAAAAESAYDKLVDVMMESTDKTMDQSEKRLALDKEANERTLALEHERLKQMDTADKEERAHRARQLHFHEEAEARAHRFQQEAEQRSHKLETARLQMDREAKAAERGILAGLTELLKLIAVNRPSGK